MPTNMGNETISSYFFQDIYTRQEQDDSYRTQVHRSSYTNALLILYREKARIQ